MLQSISIRALPRGVRDVGGAVPYSRKPEPRTLVGGGVLDAPLLALSILLQTTLKRALRRGGLLPSRFACQFSLRLGHLAALTCHRHVIHYREAASLPSEREPRALRRGRRALNERPYGVERKPVRNSRRDEGIAPYARFWIGRNIYPRCVGQAHPSPPLAASILVQAMLIRAAARVANDCSSIVEKYFT